MTFNFLKKYGLDHNFDLGKLAVSCRTAMSSPCPPLSSSNSTAASSTNHDYQPGGVVLNMVLKRNGTVQVCCGSCGARCGSRVTFWMRDCKKSDTCSKANAVYSAVQTRKPHNTRSTSHASHASESYRNRDCRLARRKAISNVAQSCGRPDGV